MEKNCATDNNQLNHLRPHAWQRGWKFWENIVKWLFTAVHQDCFSSSQSNHRNTLCCSIPCHLPIPCVLLLPAARGGAGAEGGEAAGDRSPLRAGFPADRQNPCRGREGEAGHAAVSEEGKKGTARSACWPVWNTIASGQEVRWLTRKLQKWLKTVTGKSYVSL